MYFLYVQIPRAMAMPVGREALRPNTFVAAIDFGTTFSGYAYQGRNDFETNPLKVSSTFNSPQYSILPKSNCNINSN